jgi:formate hydrogenlyase subunit 3/multisubunit Na+/H+ antiporter MnhD subunit
MIPSLVVFAFIAFGIGAVAALSAPAGRLARSLPLIAAATGAAAIATVSTSVLVAGAPWSVDLPGLLPLMGGVRLQLDAMSALFLGLIGGVAVPASIFAIGYLRTRGVVRLRFVNAAYNVFLAGMCLVPLAGDAFSFLFGWELMALASYLLVVGDAESEANVSAGAWYAVMTHLGFAALLGAFVVLAGSGPTDFAALRARAALLSPTESTIVFVLVAIAGGSKAGLVPLHVWLPRAHPAAPSHVSALMSAAMVKLGVYAALRFFVDVMPPGPAWWGGALLAAGVASALTGVLYAAAASQIKRLLAYSTIENVGLIFAGLGFALLMRGYGYQSLAATGIVVCLLHSVNHAAYKTLLFLGAGSVIHATHSSSLEAYGGLIRRMPTTAALMFVGALSLAALPPLNGFPSEWLGFQMLVAGTQHTAPELAILLPIALAAVALTAGLAAVSAVRLFGITFLALPRTRDAAAASESPLSMRLAMLIPAGLCVILGVLPSIVVPRLESVAAGLGFPAASLVSGTAVTMPIVGSRYWPLVVVGLLTLSIVTALALVRARAPARAMHVDDAWNCGRLIHSARAEYTAASFAEPLYRVFAGFYRPRQQIRVEVHPASRYFVRTIGYQGRLVPWMESALYVPVILAVRRLARAASRIQNGSIHWYLTLLPLALVALLIISRWLP